MKKFMFVAALLALAVPVNAMAEGEEIPASFDPDDTQEAREMQACYRGGRTVLRCGCWGPALPGERFPVDDCCSGDAEALPCGFFCPTGGVAYRLVCTYGY